MLNSKNHGVPQNRERVFIIGHLRENVDEKYFLSPEKTQGLLML
ncbi:DNA cytosine methyltransferase [Lactococcus lactis]|nr:DNA cytosine methyltransferase [Lactococcus lactis]